MEIEDVRREHEDQLLRLPNVIGVGIGEKGRKQVIKVFVTRKVPESALQSHEIVPKTLEGHETDVEEIGTVAAEPQ